MLIDLNWYECNKILRLLRDSHDNGVTYGGDEELEAKVTAHRRSIEVEKEWSLLTVAPSNGYFGKESTQP